MRSKEECFMSKKELFFSFIVLIASVAILFIGNGCGGGGGGSSADLPSSIIPTVTAFTDSNGTALDGAKAVDFSALNLKFAQAVDISLLSQPGVVTITCDGLPSSVAQPSLEIRAADNDADDGITGNEFTAYPTDPYKYQMLDCTLSVASNVPSKATDSSGTTPKFTNKCARSSDFNAGDKETPCWQLDAFALGDSGASTWNTWGGASGALGNVVEFDVTDGTFAWDTSWNTVDSGFFTMGKSVQVGDGDLEIIMHLTNIGTFIASAVQKGFPTSIGLLIQDPRTRNGYLIAVGAGGGSACGVMYMVDGELEDKPEQQTICDTSTWPDCKCPSDDPMKNWECYCDTKDPTKLCVSAATGTCFGDDYYLRLTVLPAKQEANAWWRPTESDEWQKLNVTLRPYGGGKIDLPRLQYHDISGKKTFGILVIQESTAALRDASALLPHATLEKITIQGATSTTQY